MTESLNIPSDSRDALALRDEDDCGQHDSLETIEFAPPIDPRFCESESLIVCLEGGPFVIVDHDDLETLQSTDIPLDDLRRLQAGDGVTYRGRHSRVLAIESYR